MAPPIFAAFCVKVESMSVYIVFASINITPPYCEENQFEKVQLVVIKTPELNFIGDALVKVTESDK